MTKTKEVNVQNSASPLLFAPAKDRRVHLRQKMENGGGTEGSGPQHAVAPQEPPVTTPGADTAEKKKVNRAPSPARPKDVPGWSYTKIRGGIGTPTLSVKPGAIHLGSRVSRRSPVGNTGGKDGKTAGKSPGKPSSTPAPGTKSSSAKGVKTRRKVSDASTGSEDLSRDSGVEKLSPADSSSELSDCASEENKLSADAASSDAESRSSRGGGAPEAEPPLRNGTSAGRQTGRPAAEKERLGSGGGSVSPGEERSTTSFDSRVPASTSLAFSDLTEELMDGVHEELVREIEELRSENDYLKDEMEELRSEMLEMRDMYMEEDVYQLQDIRQQLEQANKTCRILQYRLRKAERRSLRVAQTGQVDGELIQTLEQDVKVAKDVSIRLHSQLESGEKKRTRLEQENEELRVRLQDMEVTKQVLQQELDKNSQKKRGARPNNKPDKKLGSQEDCSDLKCQLHFAKEESALMCKKLTKLVKDGEAMKEELAKFRSLYGDVDASITVEEVADSPHTREAEVRVHLKLVEEEANLLSRRIVELEVENRGLRAEMDDMKLQDGPQELSVAGGLCGGPGGGAMVSSSENVMELQRHLQFVEEEAELLRRSLMEMEEQNKLLMNEMNRCKSELPPPTSNLSCAALASLADGVLHDGSNHPREAAVLISPDVHPREEELREAKLQIGELSGKVKKLQYENRVLLSNLQRCDLASYHDSSSRLTLETDAEAGDSAECLPSSPPLRKEPVGGENEVLKEVHADATISLLSECLRQKDHDALLAMRDQARLVSTAIQLLTSPESTCLSSSSIYHKVCSHEAAESGHSDKTLHQISELSDLADWPLVGALTSRLQALHSQLHSFVECIDGLGSKPAVNGRDPQADGALTSLSAEEHDAPDKQADCRERVEDGKEEENLPDDGPTQKQGSGSPELEEEEEEEEGSEDLLVDHLQPRDQGSAPELTDETHVNQVTRDEHQKALQRRDFQLQSLGLQARLQQKLWGQEKTLLLQESQHLKQALLLLSLKLRCFLKQWRLGCRKDTEWKDIVEMNSLKDLYLLLEEDNLSPAHQADKKEEEPPLSPTIKSSAVSSTLADLRVALQDLSGELRQERQGSQELTQQFAKAKASWEVERTELKSAVTQLETKAGKTAPSAADGPDPADLKVALKREREEHQHLLADSYAAVMDVTKQLQIGERNWGREKLELLERFGQERAQWEQRLREAVTQQSKSSSDPLVSHGPAYKTSELEESRSAGVVQEKVQVAATVAGGPESRRNWTTLTNDTPDLKDTSKTWDGSSSSNSLGSGLESLRSYTAPDKTGIRIYYSPPTVRRMEPPPAETFISAEPPAEQEPLASSSYEQWLSSLSKQHVELLESRGGCSPVNSSFTGSANSLVDAVSSTSTFRLDLGEISANLSDDMKEMTNCVRQAIRSSSLERKSSKELGSQTLVSTRATQTAPLLVSVGLQTDILPSSRGLHSKAWSPRPSSGAAASPLASARTRQISTSLDKVHGRIERPCCSPKFGSPKLQRRVSSGSTSRLDGARDRSVWSLQPRPGGSAWARSTTTRDSPVLSGLTDGLSSLFSVVEHGGSTESIWKSDGAASQTVSPARHPAAGKACPESGAPRYGGLVQEFIKNGALNVYGGPEEPRTECPPGLVGGAGFGHDSVTRIVNKRFMRTADETVPAPGRGKETNGASEDAPCECVAQASGFPRPSRVSRHLMTPCKHRLHESSSSNEDKGDSCTE